MRNLQLPTHVAALPIFQLNDGAKLVYAWIHTRAGHSGLTRLESTATIAADLGVSRRTVQRRLEELREAGLIDILEGGPGKRSAFQLKTTGTIVTALTKGTDNGQNEQDGSASGAEGAAATAGSDARLVRAAGPAAAGALG